MCNIRHSTRLLTITRTWWKNKSVESIWAASIQWWMHRKYTLNIEFNAKFKYIERFREEIWPILAYCLIRKICNSISSLSVWILLEGEIINNHFKMRNPEQMFEYRRSCSQHESSVFDMTMTMAWEKRWILHQALPDNAIYVSSFAYIPTDL